MNRELNVYLYGEKIGVLSEDIFNIYFQYEPDAKYLLSVRMPIRTISYDDSYTQPFFENLTPEGDAIKIISQKFHIADGNIFSILDKIGGDCAGAISLYEGSFDKKTDSQLLEINETDLAHYIDELPENPLLTGVENAPRLSLAGAQSKFAVCKIDGKYFHSNDNFPTTHIIKITHKYLSNLLENELFCMKLANKIFGTISVELYEVKGRKYLEIERYDRQIIDGEINRIHQEDFCQVLGYLSQRKYQQDGGPKIIDCYDAILKYSAQALADANMFINQIVFNYLIGNTDAHAKNFSILHKNDKVLLSPAYDLLSAEIYPRNIVSRIIAMKINGKEEYDSIDKIDFLALFKQLGLNATNTMHLIKSKFADIVKTAETLRDELNNNTLTKCDVYDLIIEIINKRLEKLFNE